MSYTYEKKVSRRLDDNFKFRAYQRWKRYVCDKYDDFNHEQLIEFSRYLNLLIRNKKPVIAYWKIIIPVILTVFLTKLFDMAFTVNVDLSHNIFVLMAECIFFTIVFIGEIFIIVVLCITPLFRDDSDENMLKDYKEIIDEMILEKESEN